MSDREAELRELVADVTEHEVVVDAFLAKSFTDRLLIVDIADDGTIPVAIRNRLRDNGLRAAAKVYGSGDRGSFVGAVSDATRHHFVDVRTRGTHQSYVLDG